MFWLFDYILNGNTSFGLYFIVYIWIIFLLRYIMSKRYKPYFEEYYEDVSVVIPVYNENPKLFHKCLKSVHDEEPKELIVVVNGTGKNETELKNIARSYGAVVYHLPQAAKRPAMTLGIRKAHSDIVVLLDSDTVLTKGSLKELLKPFKDGKVGGATSTQMIINQNISLVRKMAGWMEDIRFAITQRAQSSFSAVGCLPGRLIAFRRSLVLDSLEGLVNEKFFGHPCNSGDDRYLTSCVLKKGYKTVLQTTSEVYTNCPDTIMGFIKQQLRWARSSQRETIKSFGWLPKYWFTFFTYLTDIITPFFFLALEFKVLSEILMYGGRFINVFHFLMDLIFIILAMNLSIGLKQLEHFKLHPKDIWILPFYSVFMTVVMIPVRVYGFFTMHDPTWHTRRVIWTDGTSEKFQAQRENPALD